MAQVHPDAVQAHVPEISREELLGRLGDRRLAVVNVLTREAYSSVHIPGSRSLPIGELRELAAQVLPDRAQEIAVYCGTFT